MQGRLPHSGARWPPLGRGPVPIHQQGGCDLGTVRAPSLPSQGAQSRVGSAGVAAQAFCQSLWFVPDDNFVNCCTAPAGCRFSCELAGLWYPGAAEPQDGQGRAATGTQWHSRAMGGLDAGRTMGLDWKWPSPSLFYFQWGFDALSDPYNIQGPHIFQSRL